MKCEICGKNNVSAILGVCSDCIREEWDRTKFFVEKAHHISRKKFNLPPKPPKKGVECNLCIHHCKISEGERGYCGIRTNIKGKLVHLAGTPSRGIAEWYFDPLPTNCVASWCCPARDKFSPLKNLAVFYGACTFNCLYCQNWTFKENTMLLSPTISAKKLASNIDEYTYCICYFGGDPTPQVAHALKVSKLATEVKDIKICWETNGSMNSRILKKVAETSIESGGTIKIDIKAWNDNLHRALTGVTNAQTLKNIEYLGKIAPEIIVASTVLLPYYIDREEIENIARFLSSIDENIPYSLLAFYPTFYMRDLPTTSKKHALECYHIAKKYLKNVRLGNVHLLH
ncbi:MAG: radical SAM protein [Thermoplasmata archaeon]|nr:MAG: radical SAM protein [Thermoplasmata archaeon]